MKPILNLFAALAIAISLVACNSEAPLDNPLPAQESPVPAMAAEPIICTNLGAGRWFNLQNIEPGALQDNQGMDVDMFSYHFLGSVPEYRLNDGCECKITYFKLLFNDLPDHNDILLRDAGGNPVAFTGPSMEIDGDYILIAKEDISVGFAEGVNIGFFAEGESPPQLLFGGGYCVIENVDAPIEVLHRSMTDPYAQIDIMPDGQEYIKDIYMPITSVFQVP